jgi:3-hydroxyisobutyrate dehydrogenase-like beta-hydroxyacid dehydrogenase
MSRNLIDKGYSVTGYDLLEERTRDLAAAGAEIADSPKAAASGADVIISMIPDDAVLEAISVGQNGAFEGARLGAVFIDMSTVSPVVSARIAEKAKTRGIKYLRAPVSGSTALASAGTLTIFVSGPKDAYNDCGSIFEAMGQKVFHVGDGEEARYLKLVVNVMVGLTAAMVAEALTFGEAGGMNWEQMIDIVNVSVVSSPLFGYKAALLKDRNYAPAFTVAQMAKDFDIMLDAGRDKDVCLPVTALVRQLYATMRARGQGEEDFFSLVTLLEDMAGIKR